MSRDGWLPPGVTDADIDRASPGYHDDDCEDQGMTFDPNGLIAIIGKQAAEIEALRVALNRLLLNYGAALPEDQKDQRSIAEARKLLGLDDQQQCECRWDHGECLTPEECRDGCSRMRASQQAADKLLGLEAEAPES